MVDLRKALAFLKVLFDDVASIPGPELKAFIGAAVAFVVGAGIVHLATPSVDAANIYYIMSVLIAAGLAVEKALNGAANYRASFKVDDSKK